MNVLTLNFLYIRNKYSPDPEFCIFLGLGTNFVRCRYKRHLKMPCFTVKSQEIFSSEVSFFIYAQKCFEQQQLFLPFSSLYAAFPVEAPFFLIHLFFCIFDKGVHINGATGLSHMSDRDVIIFFFHRMYDCIHFFLYLF